jgi:hypothetical protein
MGKTYKRNTDDKQHKTGYSEQRKLKQQQRAQE